MKTLVLLMAIGVALALAGCPKPAEPIEQGIAAKVSKGDLALELRVPRRNVVRGQTVPVTVTASNLGKEEMTVEATSGALVYVRLWRRTALGWEQVKRLPETAAMVIQHWALPPGQSKAFELNLTVSPDWPTGEPLRITTELNGRPEVRAGGVIQVFLTQEECDRATTY